jgi:hypothetical protein
MSALGQKQPWTMSAAFRLALETPDIMAGACNVALVPYADIREYKEVLGKLIYFPHGFDQW